MSASLNPFVAEARAELYGLTDISESARYIKAHGLDRDLIEAHAGVLGICRVEFCPGQRFDFTDQGEAAAVIEAFGPDDASTVDLVAWPVGRPGAAASLFGFADVLGAARIENPATYSGGRPLHVFRTPLRWLQAGCEGVALLDPVTGIGALAEASGRIAGEDHQHARELVRALHPFVAPTRIVAPLLRRAA